MALNTIEEITRKGALHQFVENGGDDDMAILRDPPCVVEIAGRKLKVRALTLENHRRWLMIFGTIVRQYEIMLSGVEWPETKSDLEGQRQRWQTFFASHKIQKEAMAMIEQSLFREPGNRWWRWHRRWFRKNVTIMELMDLFFYLYLWNCEAPKKNATFLLRRMGFVRRKATLFGGWSKNLAGLSGAQVTPRYGSSNSSASGPPSQSTSRPNAPVPAPVRKDLASLRGGAGR